jgi:acyl-coenzyme A thioesterase PaaI-like protein
MNICELPFHAHLGLRPASAGQAPLELPDAPRNANHLGTIHASAQMALADAASGEFLLRQIEDSGNVLPVVRRFEAKFRKPAHGLLTATARFEDEQAGWQETLRLKTRVVVSVAVEVHAADGTHTLSASVDWFLQLIK